MIRLIASDIDGTLVRDYQPMNPEIFSLIREFYARGVRFTAASGRQHPNLRKLFAPVQNEIDYICENGCLIYLKGELVHRETMDYDLGQDMIATIMGTPGAEALVSGEETCYIQPKDPMYENHIRSVVGNDATVVEDIRKQVEPYSKISAWMKDGVTDQTIKYWQGLFGEYATVVYAGHGWVDMMPKGVHKGTAIRWIMENGGLTRNEAMAFGDNYNDEEMLNSVEYSYAMEKAPQEIRDFTFGTCSDVTKVLKETLRKMDRGESL
jgi:Cof subfamily protein (haloacid dehalogenase superfamily)